MMVIIQAEPFKIISEGPETLALFLLFFLRLHSGVRICCDSYDWSPNQRAVMVLSFEKFPSKTLSSISFFSSPPPLAVLPFFPHIPTLSFPPSLTYCTALPCFLSLLPLFLIFPSRLCSPPPCYCFSWAGRKCLGCFWILWE